MGREKVPIYEIFPFFALLMDTNRQVGMAEGFVVEVAAMDGNWLPENQIIKNEVNGHFRHTYFASA